MTEYSVKEYISVWNSKYKINTPFRRWLFPYKIIMKNPKTKEVEIIKESGWFSSKIKDSVKE